MSHSYDTIDQLLAKKKMFYDSANELARAIYISYRRNDGTQEGEELDDYITRMLDGAVGDMMTAVCEDLINSYGTWSALESHREIYGEWPRTPQACLFHLMDMEARSRIHQMVADNDSWSSDDEDE